MPSWQGRLAIAYYWLQRLLHPPTGELDVARERADLEALAQRYKSTIDLQVMAATAGGVPAEWLLPPGALAGRVVLYLHGGSYNSGSLRSHRALAGHIAHAARARALVVDYRLAPEYPFPAAVEDALAAYRWLVANGTAPGCKIDRTSAARLPDRPLSLARAATADRPYDVFGAEAVLAVPGAH